MNQTEERDFIFNLCSQKLNGAQVRSRAYFQASTSARVYIERNYRCWGWSYCGISNGSSSWQYITWTWDGYGCRLGGSNWRGFGSRSSY
ncbi:hypothetical protein EMCRGX_G029256 [Ephydatia muelleri]